MLLINTMFYQDGLHKFLFYLVLIVWVQSEVEMWPLVFKMPNQQIYFRLCLAVWGAIFFMGAYKHNGVVVVKMGNIHGVLVFCGCLTSQFYSIH